MHCERLHVQVSTGIGQVGMPLERALADLPQKTLDKACSFCSKKCSDPDELDSSNSMSWGKPGYKGKVRQGISGSETGYGYAAEEGSQKPSVLPRAARSARRRRPFVANTSAVQAARHECRHDRRGQPLQLFLCTCDADRMYIEALCVCARRGLGALCMRLAMAGGTCN